MKHFITKDEYKNYELTLTIVSVYSETQDKALKFIYNKTSGVKFLVNNLKAHKAEYFLSMDDAIDFFNKYE